MKVALITGINGQDGSYLAELLLEKGYEVHGIIRRSSTFNTERIEHLYIDTLLKDIHEKQNIKLHYGDMTDGSNLIRLVQEIKPDEIYNLAAMSHVQVSFDTPEYTANADATGALTGNTFDATAVTAGTYQFTYFIAGSAPCADASTIITVTVEEPYNSGTDATLDICSDNGTVDLFTLIAPADAGGTWSPALASGTGVFDPLVDLLSGTRTYTYTLSNACGTTSSNVVVTVTQAPNAGIDNSITACVIDGTIDLFPQLGGTPDSGGTWSPALASGTGVFDPNVDASGVYTYTVTANTPCSTDASAQVTVTVSDASAPTVLDANPTFCRADNPTVNDLNASISATGTLTWYTDNTLTTSLNGSESLIDGEDYYVTQTNGSGCESSQSVSVIATVNDAPTLTLINPNIDYCINDNLTIADLTLNITEYNASSNNIVWYDSVTNGNVISSGTLLTNATTYYAVIVDSSTGCESSVRLAVTPDLSACGKLVLPMRFITVV